VSLTPDLVAHIDQRRAALAELVGHVRTHQAVCDVPEAGVCCGRTVVVALTAMDHSAWRSLLVCALGELARLPAPSTTLEEL
jgi:hypothetical protein